MKLEYISHSCFLLETKQTRIAFDPWITASAYHNQWYLHPKPLNTNGVTNANLILISHGHEDHLNAESLQLINKKAHIYFPFQWREGIVGYLKHVGFKDVTETVSFHTYHYEHIRITYLSYSLESVIVVECEGFVIVNINDALNSNHETAVNYLLKEIKSRWSKIDFLLSGWSGAGYFPNKVHYHGKNDDEVARIREQYFANNFCRFTQYLQPDIAVAFAPGFILLNDENRWINEVKFPREILDSYYRENFEKNTSVKFPMAYPGDYFIDKAFHKVSAYHAMGSEKDMYKNIDNEFREEIAAANHIAPFSDHEVILLENKLVHWLNKNKTLYHPDVVADALFSIKMTDVWQRSYLNISFENEMAVVKRSDGAAKDDRLLIETRGKLLSLNFDKAWGGDLMTIGYGLNVHVFEEYTLEKNLDLVCVRLISRFPLFKDDFLKHSGRMMKYYLGNPSITNLWIKQKIKLRPYVNKYPFNERDHWITYNKCDLCKICNMPEVDFTNIG